MTNLQAHAKAAQNLHLSAEYFAFYAGRNSAERGGKCQFTEQKLITAWKQGYRDAKGEHALDMDTEWDED